MSQKEWEQAAVQRTTFWKVGQIQEGALTGLSIANPNFSNIAISVEYLHKVENVEFSFNQLLILFVLDDGDIDYS